MNEVIADFIAVAVDNLVSAMVLAGLVTVFAVVGVLNANVSQQEAVAGNLQEYSVHNQYDNNHVYPQDVVSAILKNRGIPGVSVKSNLGTHTWSKTTQATDYSVNAIVAKIDQTVVYDSKLIEGSNGEVIGYEFTQHNGSNCPVGRP